MKKQNLSKLIKGKRVSLKKHEVELAQKMFDYVAEDRERLSIFLPWPKNIKTVDDEIDFINKCNRDWEDYSGAHFGIYRNSDNEYMGNISSFSLNWRVGSCEIGYWILGKFEGQGYMSDAVKLLEKELFHLGFSRIVIRFDPNNERSGSIPRRLGYFFEGTLREAIVVDNEHRNLKVFSKLKSEYGFEDKSSRSNIYPIIIQEQENNKGATCESILRTLPDWFGVEDAIQNYIEDVKSMTMFAAREDDDILGFISVRQHNPITAEIHVMGILPSFHGKGIGTALVRKVEEYLGLASVKFLQVKTLGESRSNKEYEKTRRFYDSVGFHPVEEFKELWGEDNPCLLMIKLIG